MNSPSSNLILGIESSCDETGVALVSREGRVVVNLISSQCDLHGRFGGVVPEVAARIHIQACLPMVDQALEESGAGWDLIHAVAVTRGPGLIGCLLVGLETAKALAWLHDKPLVTVNHLSGHLYACQLQPNMASQHLLVENGVMKPTLPLEPAEMNVMGDLVVDHPPYPHMGLVVSGGHTTLVRVDSPDHCTTIIQTRDDAAGEAYDKFARVAGLGYPGGPLVDKLATEGNAGAFPGITPPMMRKDKPDFSFSGLKTQAGREAQKQLKIHHGEIPVEVLRDLCAAFQFAAVESLLQKTLAETRRNKIQDILITGGVACNRGLRKRAAELSRDQGGLRFWFPHPDLCTDNAAMIAGVAWHLEPIDRDEALTCNAVSSLTL
jgi:N6-L-threonylcarbamoyladenine synthase